MSVVGTLVVTESEQVHLLGRGVCDSNIGNIPTGGRNLRGTSTCQSINDQRRWQRPFGFRVEGFLCFTMKIQSSGLRRSSQVESKRGHIAPIIESRSKSSAAVESRRRIEKNTRKIEKPPPFGEGFSFCVVVTDCASLPPV